MVFLLLQLTVLFDGLEWGFSLTEHWTLGRYTVPTRIHATPDAGLF